MGIIHYSDTGGDNIYSIAISPDSKYIVSGGGIGFYMLNAKWNPVSVLEDPVTITDNTIYPNPISNTATLKFNLSYSCNIKISIYDITGNLRNIIYNDLMTAGIQNLKMDCSSYASGTYYCTIETQNSKDTINLIISK